MDAIFEAYLAAQRRRRPSPLTVKAIRHALGQTQRWLDEQELTAGQLTLLRCEEYFDGLLERQAVSTVRRHLAYVRAAYRYGVRHELVDRDPTADVRLPRLPDHDPATYSNEQLRQVHAAIRSEREQLVFFLFAFAGLRLSEVAGLEWRQVEFERWQIRLAGKGGKLRLVPLHPALTSVLREHQAVTGHRERVLGSLQGHRLSANTLGRSVRALVDRTGVEVDQPSHCPSSSAILSRFSFLALYQLRRATLSRLRRVGPSSVALPTPRSRSWLPLMPPRISPGPLQWFHLGRSC